MMKDRNNKLAILGERSVQRILYRTHYELDLRLQGCKYYEVYSTHGDVETQLSEVDLIEKWITADGVEHTKAHEVKCEEMTVTGDGGYFVKEKLEKGIGWALHREKTQGGFKIRGTGNVFIETEQDVPKGYPATENNKGWAIVLKETEAEANKKYTDGRDVWFVQYTPKDVPVDTFTDPDTGEQYIHTRADLEPYNYFTALQMPDTYITMLFAFDIFKEMKLDLKESYKKDRPNVVSRGYAVPIMELYNMDQLKDRILRKEDNGVTFHQDKDVWTLEKDISDDWTEDDYKIEPLKNDRY